MLTSESRTVFELLPDGVIASDDRDVILYVNPAIERMLGWPRDQLAGKPLMTIIPERLRSAHQAGIHRYFTTHASRIMGRPIRVPALRADGVEIDVELTLSAVPRPDGEQVIAIVRDLRDRVELEHQLEITRFMAAATQLGTRLSLHRDIATVLQAAVDCFEENFDAALARVWLYDDKANVLHLRASAGLAREIENSSRAVLDVATHPSKVAHVARTRAPFFVNSLADDEQFDRTWVEKEKLLAVAALPLMWREELLGVAVVFFQRTLPIEAQDVLATVATLLATTIADARLLAEHQEAVRAKDDFLAMLGHELRNPLAPIVTALELVKMRGETPFARELSIIERQAYHLVHLVDDLLDVARLAKGKITLDKSELEISLPLERAIEMTAPLIKQHHHQLIVDIPPSGLAVCGDENRLAQVFSNLLTNAAKYTPDGGKIEVSAEQDGTCVAVRVRDNGVGIAPELQPRLFDLFVQGPRGIDRQQGGLGVGLGLVRRFVGLHNGTVSATSEGPGRGSEFVVRLPMHQAALRPSVQTTRTPHPGTGTRVLVVDDNEDAALLVSELLQDAGYEVRAAFDPNAALDEVKTFEPDVAILDIGLPGMDGYALGSELRARLPHAQLIALTGYGQASDRQRSRDEGFAEHLVKPLDGTRLLAAVKAVQPAIAARPLR